MHTFFHVQIMVSNAIPLLYGITMHIPCKPSLKFINSHTQINQYGGKKHIFTLLDYESLKIEMKERETKTKISKY